MSDTEVRQALRTLVAALAEARRAVADSRAQLDPLPTTSHEYGAMMQSRRVAALGLLKSFEQMEDLIARTVRATLIYEQVDLTGFSPRAMADQAEKLGILPSSDRWSDLVRLRNQLVHEYPMPIAEQLSRLTLAWHASDELVAISDELTVYLRRFNIEALP